MPPPWFLEPLGGSPQTAPPRIRPDMGIGVCNLGDEMKVKVIAIDEQGRVKLSRKAAMRDEQDGGE